MSPPSSAAAASAAAAAPHDEAMERWPDRLLGWLEGIVPPLSAWSFALRIWLAMMLALYAAFWLQLQSASSAAVCVGILAQPKRGAALSKAYYRTLGTVIGGIVAIVFMALLNQQRTLLLFAYGLWLALCIFVSQYLQDTRSYGAVLSGYTVAIVALTDIDAPQDTFNSAVFRLAAIMTAIVAVTFINDALGSPSVWRTLQPRLAEALGEVRRYVSDAIERGNPGPERVSALIAAIAPMRPDTNAIAGELDDGENRAAGARSAIAGFYEMVAAARAFAVADGAAAANASLTEARSLVTRAVSSERADAAAASRPPLEALLADCLERGAPELMELAALQRALDVVNATAFTLDGLACLDDGQAPLRRLGLPAHRDFPVALRAAVRAAISLWVTAIVFILAGVPAASFALVQVSATIALSASQPSPTGFAKSVLIGMPLAALSAGVILFGLLQGQESFILLALAMAPVVFLGCFLSLGKSTGGVGFIYLVFTPVLIAPSNPQSYDIGSFLQNSYLVIVSAMILFVAVQLVLPVSPQLQRVFALGSARRALADALSGRGGSPTARTALNADRLEQFLKVSSGSGSVRAASVRHAFTLAQLEATAIRGHAELRELRGVPATDSIVRRARTALQAGDDTRLDEAARAIVAFSMQRLGGQGEPTMQLQLARLAADLAMAGEILRCHHTVFRRLDLGRS